MYIHPSSMYIYISSSMYTSFIYFYIFILICLLGESFSDARHETQTNPVKKLRIDNALTFTGEGGSIYRIYLLYSSCLSSIKLSYPSILSIYLSFLSIYLSISHIYLSIHLSSYRIYLFLS